MSVVPELKTEVASILAGTWAPVDGRTVPEIEDLSLKGSPVNLIGTVLYADLADSTGLALRFEPKIAAHVARAFLATCSRIIKAHQGEIRSFDGDRVMGIYIGDRQNTRAALSALKINYAFNQIVRPALEARYPQLRTGFKLAHCTGVDTSQLAVVRGGIRKDNDLVWIGRAPNVAAKLSGIRTAPHFSYVTAEVYNKLADDAKVGPANQALWSSCTWNDGPVRNLYRSSTLLEP
jgi:adenylate cyclase